jgi:hypothetical protein
LGPAGDKHSGLYGPLKSYKEKSFMTLFFEKWIEALKNIINLQLFLLLFFTYVAAAIKTSSQCQTTQIFVNKALSPARWQYQSQV